MLMYIITMDDISKSIDLIQRINNYPGLARLTKLVQTANPAITKQEIKTYLDNDNTRQLFTPQKKSKPTGHITAFQPNELWQMDIFDLSRYSTSNMMDINMYLHVLMYSREKHLLHHRQM